jgi:hypothetical protein
VTTPDLAATFRAPFRAQIAALRLRLGNRLPTAVWTDLDRAAHERAFTVAGALKADLLADLAEAVGRAIEEGRGIEWFRTEFRRIVQERGWYGWTGEGTARGEAWRTKVIYRTNVLTSYASGRMAQLREAGYRFWIYRHGGSIEPRIQHLGWDGLILEPDHPFWRTHAPPNGWGCKCRIRGADTKAGAVRKGGRPGLEPPPGYNTPDPRTGAPPGIDKGWDYAVGASVADEVAQIVRRAQARLPASLATDLGDATQAPAALDAAIMERDLATILPDWIDAIRQTAGAAPALIGEAERLALAAYTVPKGYLALNRALRGEIADGLDRAAFGRWETALRAALAGLPKAEGTVWRGIDATPDLLNRFSALRPGAVVEFRAFTSTAASEASALGGEVLLELRGRSGRSIAPFSFMPKETEVLFRPGTQFRVVDSRSGERNGYEALIMVLEEVTPLEIGGAVIERMTSLAGLG